jgi:hypothetical protein
VDQALHHGVLLVSWSVRKSFFRIVHFALDQFHHKEPHADDEEDGEQAQQANPAVEQQIEYDIHFSLPVVD